MVTKNPSRASEQGFTLIELSIVLVLIGLIIGGVLKGQELVSSTQLKTSVAQWDATKAAVNSFVDRYQALPGDYDGADTFINADLEPGDGDGVVGPGSIAAVTTDALSGDNDEAYYFWAHLFRANLITGVREVTADTEYILPTKTQDFFMPVDGTFGGQTAIWLRWQNAQTGAGTDALTPNQAAEIDRKYDDGLGPSGTVQSSGETAANCIDADDGTYVGGNAVACITVLETQ